MSSTYIAVDPLFAEAAAKVLAVHLPVSGDVKTEQDVQDDSVSSEAVVRPVSGDVETEQGMQDDSVSIEADGSASVGIAPVNTESVTAGAPMVCQVCNMTIPTTSLRTHVEAEHCPAVARFRCKQCRKIHGFNEANVKTHLRHRHHLQEAEIEDNIMKCENGLTVAVWSLAFNNCFPSYDTRGELGKLFKLNVSNQKRFTCLSCIGVDVPEAHRLLHVAKKHETEELYHCTSVGCTDIFLSETAHDDHARHAHNGVGEPLIGTIATKAFIENRDKDILKTFFSA